jgi:hypothetical protein
MDIKLPIRSCLRPTTCAIEQVTYPATDTTHEIDTLVWEGTVNLVVPFRTSWRNRWVFYEIRLMRVDCRDIWRGRNRRFRACTASPEGRVKRTCSMTTRTGAKWNIPTTIIDGLLIGRLAARPGPAQLWITRKVTITTEIIYTERTPRKT